MCDPLQAVFEFTDHERAMQRIIPSAGLVLHQIVKLLARFMSQPAPSSSPKAKEPYVPTPQERLWLDSLQTALLTKGLGSFAAGAAGGMAFLFGAFSVCFI